MALNFPYPASEGQIYYDPTSGNRYIYRSSLTSWVYAANNNPLSATANTQVLFNYQGGISGSNDLLFDGVVLYVSNVSASHNIYSTYIYADGSQISNIMTQPNYQAPNYTLTVGDAGKVVVSNGGNVFVLSDTFYGGQNLMVYNNTAATMTLTQNAGVTLHLAGVNTPGNRFIAQRGYARLSCIVPNTFVVSGSGVT